MPRPATDKRARLVSAAAQRFHERGFVGTSLAEVAKTAGVAAGNVFYYFRTKEELAKAVVDEWVRRLTGFMALFEVEEDRWRRLEVFADQAMVMRGTYVTLGCPLAGLARDLRQAGRELRSEAPRLYRVQHGWVGAQFRDLGFTPDEADEHARFLLAGLHGAILLAHAQDDERLIASGVRGLKDRLRRLRETSAGPTRRPPAQGSARR